jgi:two-component system cell cycle response regulator CtrA
MVELLCEKVDKAVTKEMFLERLYGGGDEPELKIVDVYMCKIRKKLRNASGGKQYIDTIWGRGHVLRDPGETEVPTDAQASAS